VGIFTDDPETQELIAEASKIRQEIPKKRPGGTPNGVGSNHDPARHRLSIGRD
jgi:hypothetical protein